MPTNPTNYLMPSIACTDPFLLCPAFMFLMPDCLATWLLGYLAAYQLFLLLAWMTLYHLFLLLAWMALVHPVPPFGPDLTFLRCPCGLDGSVLTNHPVQMGLFVPIWHYLPFFHTCDSNGILYVLSVFRLFAR